MMKQFGASRRTIGCVHVDIILESAPVGDWLFSRVIEEKGNSVLKNLLTCSHYKPNIYT
jgi:hypothetical protein